jgi:hypothetical protein
MASFEVTLQSIAPSKLLNYVQKQKLIDFVSPQQYAELEHRLRQSLNKSKITLKDVKQHLASRPDFIQSLRKDNTGAEAFQKYTEAVNRLRGLDKGKAQAVRKVMNAPRAMFMPACPVICLQLRELFPHLRFQRSIESLYHHRLGITIRGVSKDTIGIDVASHLLVVELRPFVNPHSFGLATRLFDDLFECIQHSCRVFRFHRYGPCIPRPDVDHVQHPLVSFIIITPRSHIDKIHAPNIVFPITSYSQLRELLFHWLMQLDAQLFQIFFFTRIHISTKK